MNAVPTKMCADCLIVLPASEFPTRMGNAGRTYLCNTCPECTRRRWREAHDRSRVRRGKAVGTRRPRVVAVVAETTKPGFIPPRDFLPMGEPDPGIPLRWSL